MADIDQFSAKLVADDGTEYELAGEMKVGRVAACEITIEDPRISRAHAVIKVEGDRVTVEDLGSANGSRINDVLAEGAAELSDGDVLSFENHHLKVVITRPVEEDDADMTMISAPVPEPDNDVTMVGGFTAPVIETAAEPAPEPKAAAAPKAARSAAIPDAWQEDPDDGEHTQFLTPGSGGHGAAAMAAHVHQRESDLAHLQVILDGVATDLYELAVSDGSEPDVWEIGRAESCQIALSDPSVSTRHAQLIHQSGRWRMVNLVSSNGIFVNEEKRLTAYLGDNDKIRLGTVNLVFRSAEGAAVAPPPPGPSSGGGAAAATGGGGMDKKMLIIGGVVAALVVLGVAAFFVL